MNELLYVGVAAMTAVVIAICFLTDLTQWPQLPPPAARQAAFYLTLVSVLLGALWPLTWVVVLCCYLVPKEEG